MEGMTEPSYTVTAGGSLDVKTMTVAAEDPSPVQQALARVELEVVSLEKRACSLRERLAEVLGAEPEADKVGEAAVLSGSPLVQVLTRFSQRLRAANQDLAVLEERLEV